MDVINAQNLVKRFGQFKAVDSISFQVKRGELFGLLGPNGAGKTTAINMIYGFSPLTSGEMKVFGLNIETDWREIRSRLGVCQQNNTLDPDLTVEQNLRIYTHYFDMDKNRARQRVEEMLTFFALHNKRRAQVSELSGGLARRLQLVRTLMAEPELLVLDEPTTGLDPQSRHQVWDRLIALKKQGLTLLLTTHYMDEAAYLCNRLMIMDHGKIITEGHPRDLIIQHAAENVVEIEGPDQELRNFVRQSDMKYDELEERIIIYTKNQEKLNKQFREKFCMDACLYRAGNLEDVFLRLTGRELRE